MSTESPPARVLKHPVHLCICAGLVLLFGILSFSAVLTKSPTYDEPMHALGGWMHLHEGDFRINFEDPPLWQYWAMIPNGSGALQVNLNHPLWLLMPDNIYNEWGFTVDTLFGTPGNDGVTFINRARAMMVLMAMGLCVVVVIWAWQLAGPTGAVIAGALVALDPNLIGHGALVKNDVPMALMMTAVFLACWRAGKNLTVANAITLSLLVAASVNIKYSAAIFAPMMVVLMIIRAVLPQPWMVLGRETKSIGLKLASGVGLLAGVAIVSYFSIWICYGFRFGPASDSSIQLNTESLKYEAVDGRYSAEHPPLALPAFDTRLNLSQQFEAHANQLNSFSRALNELNDGLKTAKFSQYAINRTAAFGNQMLGVREDAIKLRNQVTDYVKRYTDPATSKPADFSKTVDTLMVALHNSTNLLTQCERGYVQNYGSIQMYLDWEKTGSDAPDGFIRLLNVFLDNHLLPSAWVHGMLFVHARSFIRGTFLLGQLSNTGWWYYFPMAMLFKTPIATLLTLLASTVVGGLLIYRRREHWKDFAWPAACLLVPAGIYMVSVMSANLNIGLRHVLCVYPLMYIAAAVVIVRAMTQWPWMVKMHLAPLALMLLVETLSAWPNYVAYFNFTCGGPAGGLGLLADSNLDWGQDLPALRNWQKQHQDVKLALGYFGITKYDNNNPDSSVLPRFYGINFDTLPTGPPDPKLTDTEIVAVSATYLQGVYSGDQYTAYRQYNPIAVLNGTIYLFDLRRK